VKANYSMALNRFANLVTIVRILQSFNIMINLLLCFFEGSNQYVIIITFGKD